MNKKVLGRLQKLLNRWTDEYTDLTSELYSLGGKSESLQYNLLSTRALALSECIDDVRTMMLNHLLGSGNE